mmetsp:Transcript_16477/g.25425  ORF Transcript_16477/g.25425 Transcript_16477/m.25425 type:complete len:503 (-) Transcript_16477:468-1976(-)
MDIDKVYDILDDNRDGKVSYLEFLNHLAACSSTTQIDDPTHWAFRIFEDIRRKVAFEDKSLCHLFKVPKGEKNPSVPWSKFKDLFRDLNIHLLPHQESDLKDFLDCEGAKELVDLQHFQDLVGLYNDQTANFKEEVKRSKAAPAPKRGQRKDKRYRSKMAQKMLTARGIEPSRLRMEFRASSGKKDGTLPRKLFCEILDYECDPNQTLDASYLDDIAEEFSTSKDQVNYENFLSSYASILGLRTTEAYLFGQLGYLAQNEKTKLPSAVFKNHFKDTKLRDLDHKQLARAMKDLHIMLSDEEIDMLLLKYDPTGDGRVFDLQELDDEFKNWESEEYKKKNVSQKQSTYAEFDKHQSQLKKNPKAPAAVDSKKVISPVHNHTAGQEKIFQKVKKWVTSHKKQAKIEQMFKQTDKNYSGFLTQAEIHKCLADSGLSIEGGQTADLCSFLSKREKDGAFNYEDLLKLLSGEGPDPVKKKDAFIKDPLNQAMGDIGKKILAVKDYEK